MNKAELNQIPENKINFLTDIVEIIEKHKVSNCLLIYSMNEQINNSLLTVGGAEPDQLYCKLSDGIQSYLSLGYDDTNTKEPAG